MEKWLGITRYDGQKGGTGGMRWEYDATGVVFRTVGFAVAAVIPCREWVLSPRVVAHELGHAFDLRHTAAKGSRMRPVTEIECS